MSNADFFPIERNRYFYGKLLTVRDFEIEQRYARQKSQLMNRLSLGAGVLCGLGVTASDDSTLLIESGIALDYQGRMVVVEEELAVPEKKRRKPETQRSFPCLFAQMGPFIGQRRFSGAPARRPFPPPPGGGGDSPGRC